MVEENDPMLAGMQETDDTITALVTKLTLVLLELLLYAAVIVELALLLIVPVVTLNVPETACAPTVTELGAFKAELLFDKATVTPPLGAAWLRATVQVLEEFEPRLDGLHESDDSVMETGAAVKVMVALTDFPL